MTKTSDLIKAKLGTSGLLPRLPIQRVDQPSDEAAHPDKIGHMNYTSFESAITDKYGIVHEGWPLETFCTPSSVGSQASLELLYAAWLNGTARFRRLTPAESRERNERRAEELRLAAIAAAEAKAAAAAAPSASISNENTVTQHIPIDPALCDNVSTLTVANEVGPATSSPAGFQQGTQQVFTANGVLVQKPKRKQRSDKGVPRGSYKAGAAKKTAGKKSAGNKSTTAPPPSLSP